MSARFASPLNTADRKHCPQCEKTKLRTSFYRNAARPDGIDSWCKKCRNMKENLAGYRAKKRLLAARARADAWEAYGRAAYRWARLQNSESLDAVMESCKAIRAAGDLPPGAGPFDP